MTNLDLFTQHVTTSQQLYDFSNNLQAKDVTFAQLMDSLSQKSFASIFFILALLCFIPGVSILAGAVLILPSLQVIHGRSTLVLPNKIAQKSIDSKRLLKNFRWLLPKLRWLEKKIKPRGVFFSSPTAKRILGSVVLMNAVIVAIPFPLSNVLPAIALVFISLGMLEKDGLFIVLGVIISVVGMLASWAVINSLIHYSQYFFF